MTAASSAAAARIERPASGGTVEVAPGVLWGRLPLPDRPDHVNVWLLADGDAWTLVDTGHGDRATQAAWDGLARGALRGRPIRRVIATHHHPGHIGLAAWLARRWHAELWTTRAEWLSARAHSLRPLRETRVVTRDHYRRAGAPAEAVEPIVERCRAYPDGVAVPPTYRRLRDGEELSVGGVRWRVLVGGGHAPEHACLFAPERGLFLSGDQVLPHVTPNVSVWPSEPDDDPLAAFLASLERLRGAVPDDALVLPAHGRPFVGLRWRCDELALHHRARLEAALIACAEPITAWDVMGVLVERTPDAGRTSSAMGEALAHLNHLVAPDRYVCTAVGLRDGVGACGCPPAARARRTARGPGTPAPGRGGGSRRPDQGFWDAARHHCQCVARRAALASAGVALRRHEGVRVARGSRPTESGRPLFTDRDAASNGLTRRGVNPR